MDKTLSVEIKKVMKTHELARNKLSRLHDDILGVESSIEAIKYLQLYSGKMVFTGASGRLGEENTMLRTVPIGLLGGCKAVPTLLLELAQKKLKALALEAEHLLSE